MSMRSASVLAAVIGSGLVGAIISRAGPLDPPAGPVAPTYKTLTEVEPRIAINATNTPGDAHSLYKISKAGSYYLTGDIPGVSGKHGIEIAASGVTLDLNGFDLMGVPAMGAFDGVSVTVGNATNIAVVGGSIRGWGRDGVNLGTSLVTGCRVEGVNASGNERISIYAGVNSRVSGCTASGGQFGIFALVGSTLSGCSVSGTTDSAFNADSSIVTNCSSHNNIGTGFTAGYGSTLTNCSAYLNTGDGISVFMGSTVTTCSTHNNTGAGITAGSGSTVEGCSAQFNALDGVRCGSACVIRGNNCASNGFGDGAGVHATGGDNQIEGNICTNADRGIDVDQSGNIIIRNTCSGNTTNWDVVAGNVVLVVNAATAGAVNGNAGGVAPGSTDPNANFTY